MSEFPSANVIARAIVTAAREMGEDPEAIVLRLPRHRSRYYAMFALAHAYPEARKSSLARCCGAPGRDYKFWDNSTSNVYNPAKKRIRVPWWNKALFGRVCEAVWAAADLETRNGERLRGAAVTEDPSPPQGRPKVRLSARDERYDRPAPVPQRRNSVLEEAARNTARMQGSK